MVKNNMKRKRQKVYKVSFGHGKGFFYSSKRYRKGSYLSENFGNFRITSKKKGSIGKVKFTKMIKKPTRWQRLLSPTLSTLSNHFGHRMLFHGDIKEFII